MSQYISSYLLEPVARRLSRSASASEPYHPLVSASSDNPSSPSAGPVDEPIHNTGETAIDDSHIDHGLPTEPALIAAPVAFHRPSSSPASASHTLQHVARPRYPTIEEAGVQLSRGHSESHLPHHRSRNVNAESDRIRQLPANPASVRNQSPESSREWRSTRPSSFQQSVPGYSISASGQLPEDDGMGVLRRKILAIQTSDCPINEKSRLVHALMTERYSTLRATSPLSGSLRCQSAMSASSADRPATPTSGCSLIETSSPATSCSLHGSSAAIRVSAADRNPTYWIPPEESASRKPTPTKERSDPVLGCAHYKRNVKLQCSTCARWYTCRLRHDAIEDHGLKRHETQNMLCMLCGSAQPAAEQCRVCEQPAAWYYCDLCKLWDNDPNKSIYHCDDCGICRVGKGLGKDFFHCQTCSACLSIAIRDSHRCIERSTDCDCPICGEYMFTSPQAVVFMPCGHSIHYTCYNQHVQTSYKCPLCSRSLGNMEMAFREIERAIENQPMPPQFADTRVWISCNDCCGKSLVQYHWLGLRCTICDSYNTVQLQMSYDPAAGDDVGAPPSGTVLNTGSDAMNSLLHTGETRERPAGHLRVGSGTRASSLLRAASARQPELPRQGARRTHSLPSAAAVPLPSAPRVAVEQRLPQTPREVDASNANAEDGASSVATSEESDFDDVDDIDFWGGESPRSGASVAGRWPEDVGMLDSDESAGGSDAGDGSDEDLSEDHDEDGDDDDDGIDVGVGFGSGSIELIGHR